MKKFLLHGLVMVVLTTMLVTALGVDGYLYHCACKGRLTVSLYTPKACCDSEHEDTCDLTHKENSVSVADKDGCCHSQFFSLKLDVKYIASLANGFEKGLLHYAVLSMHKGFEMPAVVTLIHKNNFLFFSNAPPLFGRDLVCFLHSFKIFF